MRNRRLLLDTSAYSRLRTGHPEVHDRVGAADIVVMTPTSLGELEAGFRLGRRYDENKRVLEEFLAEPFVSIAPITAETSWLYGRVFAQLRRAGTPIPVNDIWIAAAAMESSAHLLTFDRDFAAVEALEHTILPV